VHEHLDRDYNISVPASQQIWHWYGRAHLANENWQLPQQLIVKPPQATNFR